MAIVRPFRALRPTPEAASRVASVPYDVVDTAEARRLADGNEDSFLRVIRPEIELPDGADAHADEVYARGRRNLDALRARGVLVVEERPRLYLYRIEMNGKAQSGIVGAYDVGAYDAGRIVKHERTRPDKEDDRTKHITTLGAQTGPVFLTFRSTERVDTLIAVATASDREPLFDFTAPDGVRHTVRRLDDARQLVEAFGAVDPIYVADGHHRTAAASRALRERVEAAGGDGAVPADDPARSFLGVAFPSHAVGTLSYNRLIHDVGGRSSAEVLDALRAVTSVEATATDDPSPHGAHEACAYTGGRWWRLALAPLEETPVGRLAPQVLQDRILGPVFGITEPRTDPRISFVGGIRGTGELAERVDAGRAALAFSLPPVTPDELIAVADAGAIMPPKSTWFEPKLRSGLFSHLLG